MSLLCFNFFAGLKLNIDYETLFQNIIGKRNSLYRLLNTFQHIAEYYKILNCLYRCNVIMIVLQCKVIIMSLCNNNSFLCKFKKSKQNSHQSINNYDINYYNDRIFSHT